MKRTVLLVFAAASVAVTSHSLSAQDLPQWTLHETQSLSMYMVTVQIQQDVVLSLAGDPGDHWRRYEEEKAKFEEWFEKEKEEKEKAYNRARGEGKISAARDLIKFIIDAKIRWQKIQVPKTGTWEGSFDTKYTFGGPVMSGGGSQTGRMTLELEKQRFDDGYKVKSDIADGKDSFSIGFGSGGMTLGAVEADGEWTAELAGTASHIRARLAGKMIYSRQEAEAGFLPGFGAHVKRTGGSAWHGEGYLVDEVGRKLLITRSTSPADPATPFGLELELTNQKDFEFQELLDRYFKQFVNAIDSFRASQLGSASSHSAKAAKAYATVKELLGAEALGQAAGVTPAVIDEAGLTHADPGSLYDKWFKTWFEEALAAKNQRVGGASGDAKAAAAKDRFRFVVETIGHPMRGSVVSESLFHELDLDFESALIDRVYSSYYRLALASWITKLQVSPSLLEAAKAWLWRQAAFSQAGIISESAAASLGLTSQPPTDQAALVTAAGGTP